MLCQVVRTALFEIKDAPHKYFRPSLQPFYQPFFPKSCTYEATLPPQRFEGVLHNHSSLDEDLLIRIHCAVRTGIRIPPLFLYL